MKTTTTRGQRSSLRAKLLLAFVSVLLSLLATEAVFRIAGIRAEFHEPRFNTLHLRKGVEPPPDPYGYTYPLSMLCTHYATNPRGYFAEGNRIDHRFNSVGWRDAEHSFEKPAGTYRILGLGDSYLYGQGVRHEDICLSRLGKQLQDNYPEITIETINTGVSAINTAQERDLLANRGLLYSPDLVIVHFVLNDVEKADDIFLERPKVDFTEDYVELYNTPDAISEYSYLWGWARQRIQQNLQSRAYIRSCVDSFRDDASKWQQCQAALNDIATICDSRGIKLVVVIFPFFVDLNRDYPFQSIHDTVREFCKSQGINVLDLREDYSEYKGPDLWVHATDQHPNEDAHEIAAESMAKYLREHPEIFAPARSESGDSQVESSEKDAPETEEESLCD